MKGTKLPTSFEPYFWDVKFGDLEVKKNMFFVIKRVLDRGNTNDIKWLLRTYGKEEIKKVVMTTIDLSAKTANFWAEVLHIPKSKVPCLQKPYSRIHFGLFS